MRILILLFTAVAMTGCSLAIDEFTTVENPFDSDTNPDTNEPDDSDTSGQYAELVVNVDNGIGQIQHHGTISFGETPNDGPGGATSIIYHFSLSNGASASLDLGTPTLENGDAANWVMDLSNFVPGEGPTDFTITYDPSTDGYHDITLLIPYNNFDGQPLQINLLGQSNTSIRQEIYLFATDPMPANILTDDRALRNRLCEDRMDGYFGDTTMLTVLFFSYNEVDSIPNIVADYSVPTDYVVKSPYDIVIAENWDSLFDGDLVNSLATAQVYNGAFGTTWWSGANPDGSVDTINNCDNWNSISDGVNGAVGDTQTSDGMWLTTNPASCDIDRHFLCVAFHPTQ